MPNFIYRSLTIKKTTNIKQKEIVMKSILGSVIFVIILSILTWWISIWEAESLVKSLVVFFPAFLVIAVIVAIGIAAYRKLPDSEKNVKHPIIFQIPENHDFILRRALFSNSETQAGYHRQKEGWGIYVPVITIPMGFVSKKKISTDICEISVNTKDSQNMRVDAEYITQIYDTKMFVANIDGSTIEEKEKTRKDIEKTLISTALNRAASKYNSIEFLSLVKERPPEHKGDPSYEDEVIILGKTAISEFVDVSEKKDAEKDLTAISEFVDVSEKKDAEKDLEDASKLPLHEYGIKCLHIGVQKTYAPEVIEKAKEREKAAEVELAAAESEAKAMEIMISTTKANPTAVMVAQTVADALRGLLNFKNK